MPSAIYNKGSAQGIDGVSHPLLSGNKIRPMEALARLPIIEPIFGATLPHESCKLGSAGEVLRYVPTALHGLSLAKELRVEYSLSNGIDTLDGDDVVPRLTGINTGDAITKIREILVGPWGGWAADGFISSGDTEDNGSVDFLMELEARGRYDSDAGQWYGVMEISVQANVEADGEEVTAVRAGREYTGFGLSEASPVVLTVLGAELPMLAYVVEGAAGDLTGYINITVASWLDWE